MVMAAMILGCEALVGKEVAAPRISPLWPAALCSFAKALAANQPTTACSAAATKGGPYQMSNYDKKSHSRKDKDQSQGYVVLFDLVCSGFVAHSWRIVTSRFCIAHIDRYCLWCNNDTR